MSNDGAQKEQDRSRFDKELENFEFFDDKKAEVPGDIHTNVIADEPQVSNSATAQEEKKESQPEVPANDSVKVEATETANDNMDVINQFEGTPDDEKKSDIFSFEEVKPEKKEDFANEVDKMLSQINN
jgi:flagellar basal body L-ring protein FlgH